MKVNVSQLQAGFTKYLDAEFIQKLTGVQKWVFGATAAMMLGNFGSIYNKLKTNPMVIMLDVIDENEHIDIDKLYRYFKAEAQKTPASIQVPGIGMVTLTEQDVDRLYNYTVNS